MRILLAAMLVVAFTGLSGCSQGTYHAPYTPPPLQAPTYKGPWGALDTAQIRPGVQVVVAGAQCTSNFLFRSADNKTLYLGVAAHCFGEDPSAAQPVGTSAMIGTMPDAGVVAYNGWAFDPAGGNDFGLVAIKNTKLVRSQVNPTILYWGGPIGLGDQAALTVGTQVITYGHSSQRPPEDPENPRSGHIYAQAGDGQATVITNYPGIHGDSGSGLMDVSGNAIGVLSTKTEPPALDMVIPEERDRITLNNYVSLADCLARMREADPSLADVELVTAPLLRTPELPISPPGPLPVPLL